MHPRYHLFYTLFVFSSIVSFSPNSLLWGSLLGKKGWPRYALAAFLELVRHVSALCPLSPRLQSCLTCVRHLSVVSAVAGSPCVHLVSASCPLGRAPKPCPSCVRLMSGLASPPNLGLVPASPGIGLVSALAAPPSVVSPMLPSVSAMCPLLVFSLFSRCPLVVRSLSALCRFLAGSLVWIWPGLCQFRVRALAFVCSVSVVVHLSRSLCGCAFARCSSGHL